MPYEIVKEGYKWIVRNEKTKRILGHHKTKKHALLQLRAIYSNSKK